jgi:peptidyl-tRNA hydrolase
MEEIPSAEEFDRDCALFKNSDKLIAFAKLHVERALKIASEKVMIKVTTVEELTKIQKEENSFKIYNCNNNTIFINTILNAYPLSNIQ